MLAALSAAVAAVILQGRPEHVAMLALIGVLLARGRWRRAVYARVRQHQEAGGNVVSAAGYLRREVARNGERLDAHERKIRALWAVMSLAQDATEPAPEDVEKEPPARKLSVVKRSVS